MARWGNTIDVNVSIEVNDVIDELTDDELIEELKQRKIDLSQYGMPDATSLKQVIAWWFKTGLNCNIWTFSDKDILNIIKGQLNIKE